MTAETLLLRQINPSWYSKTALHPKRSDRHNLWKPEESMKYLEGLGFRCTYKNVSKTHPVVLGEK